MELQYEIVIVLVKINNLEFLYCISHTHDNQDKLIYSLELSSIGRILQRMIPSLITFLTTLIRKDCNDIYRVNYQIVIQ